MEPPDRGTHATRIVAQLRREIVGETETARVGAMIMALCDIAWKRAEELYPGITEACAELNREFDRAEQRES